MKLYLYLLLTYTLAYFDLLVQDSGENRYRNFEALVQLIILIIEQESPSSLRFFLNIGSDNFKNFNDFLKLIQQKSQPTTLLQVYLYRYKLNL